MKLAPPHRRGPIIAATIAALALALSACGGDEEATTGSEHPTGHSGATKTAPSSASSSGAIDRAFVADMTPHHESAVEMAEIALERGQSDFVKTLAGAIIAAQKAEIETMQRVDADLAKTAEIGDLGVPDHMKGMEQDIAELRDAKDFDRAFVDMMIPHHEGAIEMAGVEIAKGDNAELKELARSIVSAQKREIAEMTSFRKREDGAGTVAPSHGVTAAGEESSSPNKAHTAAPVE